VANYSRQGTPVYLRKYDNLSTAIEDYFKVISKAKAYQNFRIANFKNEDPYELVNYLTHYSERRWAYVEQLKTIMRQNNFTQYDRYRIDPEYIKKKRTLR
jgi:Bax protein